MSNSTENTAALGAAKQEIEEESLVLKFRKPYKFEARNTPRWTCPAWRT